MNSRQKKKIKKEIVREKRPVVWADAEELLEKVLIERNFIEKPTVKIMVRNSIAVMKMILTTLM